MKYPKVSIVIPVYNGANYLRNAVDSALSQDYSNIEVIVVNDGSTDNGKSESIAQSYGNRIRYFKKKNGGVSSALNLGIKKMTGEWFSWLSHDDVYYKSKISNQINTALSNPSAKFIYGRHDYIDKNGDKINRQLDWPINKNISLVWQLLYADYINGCSTLIHKDIFSVFPVFNEGNRTAQDYEMWLLITSNFPSSFCNQLLVSSRQHDEMGTITMSDLNKKDTLETVKRVGSILLIEQIFPEIIKYHGSDKNIFIAKKHNLVGDMFVNHWGISSVASMHYKLSKRLWNSFQNPAFYKQFIVNWWYVSKPIRNTVNTIIWKSSTVFRND